MTMAQAMFGEGVTLEDIEKRNAALNTPAGSVRGKTKKRQVITGVKRKSRPKCPLEYDEQVVFCEWLFISGYDYFSVPNENTMSKLNRKTAAIQISKAKKSGLQAGVQDMIVFGKYQIYFIEMKRRIPSMSKVSDDQKIWEQKIKKYPYAVSYIAYGADQAIVFVKKSEALKARATGS